MHPLQPIQNRYNALYFEDVVKVEKTLKRRTLCYNVVEKITMVAIGSILAAVFAISFGFGASIAGLPTMIFGAVLLTPFLAIFMGHFHAKVAELKGERDLAVAIADTLRRISNWTDAQIIDELGRANVQLGRVQMEALSEMNPQRPLQALLPLLARFIFWKELQNANHQMVQRAIQFQPSQQDSNVGPFLIYHAQLSAMRRLESEEIPASMNGAWILNLILNPTYLTRSLKDIGYIRIKEPDERLLGRLFQRPDDHYFVFRNPERAPLNFDDVQVGFAALSPDLMWRRLFQTA